MKQERTVSGWQGSITSGGFARFFDAAFLSLWLVFWFLGEAFAIWILIEGALSLITGKAPTLSEEPVDPHSAVPIAIFLLIWLTLWTFGGIMAIRELLRTVGGEDIIRVRPDVLEVEHRYGPISTTTQLARIELRRVYMTPVNTAITAESTRGATELTRLGTAGERTELMAALRAELQLHEDGDADIVVPEG